MLQPLSVEINLTTFQYQEEMFITAVQAKQEELGLKALIVITIN
jgi:hypothetical protein